MFDYITKTTFYGNTPLNWFLTFMLMMLSVIVGRAVYWAIGKTIKRLTAQTRTRLDDILVDMIEEPFVLFITLFGIRQSFKLLTLSSTVESLVKNIYHFCLVFTTAWLITRLFNSLVEEYVVPMVEKSETDLDDLLLPFIRKFINVTIWVLAVIMALNNAGYDVGAILAGLGIGGLAFALAAKETVSNLIGAVTIFIDRPFAVGELIRFEGYTARVEEIGMRSTRLRVLFEERALVVPNSDLVNTKIVNISAEPSRVYDIVFPFSLNTSTTRLKKAQELIIQIIDNHKYTENKKMVGCKLGVSVVEITVKFWVTHDCLDEYLDYLSIRAQIYMQVFEAFEKEGLRIARPSGEMVTGRTINPEIE